MRLARGRQALHPYISDGRSCFWVTFRFFKQCSGSLNFLSGVLGVDFREYNGIATLNQAPFYFFSFVFNNLTTPQLSVTHLQDSPYSQQSKRNLKDGKSISLHRTKQMSVLVPGNLLYGDVLWLCWFFFWRNLSSFTTMLPYMKRNRVCYNIPSIWPTQSKLI